jgi:hypothetical protein
LISIGQCDVLEQEYDSKHGITIVKSIVEGVNYRYDDGSNSKDLIKHLKLLPRSVKEAAVRTNHFGKDFIRQNISKVTHDHHSLPASPSAASPAGHSHHLRTTHAYDSPSKHATKTPAPSSPSQLDPFIALIPPHRQTPALEAAQLFNSSAHQTSSFSGRARTTLPSPTRSAMAASLTSDSRPVTSCGKLPEESSTRGPVASKAELRIAEDKRTEMLFKRLTQENPGILEKIKNM